MRRLGAAAAVAAVLLASACAGTSSHRASTSTTAADVWRGGPSGREGTSCLDTLHRAGSATLAAPSFTVDQAAWREHPASSTVSGGGGAVITYTAPDRFHVRPVSSAATRAVPVEQIFIGPQAWQGSARAGWAAYTTHRPADPVRWLRVPAAATRARWTNGWCAFSADVTEGAVTGKAGLDSSGHVALLTMTLTTRAGTIQMRYRVSRVGSSPRVVRPGT